MFLTRFLLVAALLLAFSTPLLVLARSRRDDHTGRNFLIAALVIAAICGVLAESSARLVVQCFESGSPGCVDIGAAGFQVLLIALYLIVTVIMTYVIWRE